MPRRNDRAGLQKTGRRALEPSGKAQASQSRATPKVRQARRIVLNNALLNVQCFLALSGIFLGACACVVLRKYECSLLSLAVLRAGDMYVLLPLPVAFADAASILHCCPGAALTSLNFVQRYWLQQQLAALCSVVLSVCVPVVHFVIVNFAL